MGYSVNVEFEVREHDAARTPAEPEIGRAGCRPPGAAGPPRARSRRWPEGGAVNLNPRYTFRTFIVGSANRLAHAASLSVAERPGDAYNPLFLYGGVGLGKTHLMHAIGNAVVTRFPRKRVVYATSEKFTNDFITSIQQGRIDDFRARYRKIDLLLIDDIQFIADKERTQEEFFHTFNAIHEDGKQIVLSSDRPPKQIATLEERLRSRFEWGLIADLTAPDLETRIAILRTKAEEQGVRVDRGGRSSSSPARSSPTSASSRARSTASSPTPACRACPSASTSRRRCSRTSSTARASAPSRRSASSMAVSDYYDVDLDALRGQKRDRAIVVPRQIAMYLMRAETDVSLLRIGAELAAATTPRCCTPAQDRPGGRAQRGAAPRAAGGPGGHLLGRLGARGLLGGRRLRSVTRHPTARPAASGTSQSAAAGAIGARAATRTAGCPSRRVEHSRCRPGVPTERWIPRCVMDAASDESARWPGHASSGPPVRCQHTLAPAAGHVAVRPAGPSGRQRDMAGSSTRSTP